MSSIKKLLQWFFFALMVSTSSAAESFAPVSVPIASAEGVTYLNTSNWFWSADLLAGFIFALVLLVSGRGAKLYNCTLRITRRRRYFSIALFAAIYFSVDFVLHLPIDFLWDRAHDRLVGATSEASVAWLIPKIGEWILTVSEATVASLLLYLITEKFRHRWWLVAAAISSIATFIFLIAEPFTQVYKPMGRSLIEQRIAELAGRVGVPQGSIVVQHCNPADSCPDGRVIGLGPTRLMLLNDAQLAKNPEKWTLQMVAHESKHFSMDDNVKAFFLLSALSFFVFWLIGIFDMCCFCVTPLGSVSPNWVAPQCHSLFVLVT